MRAFVSRTGLVAAGVLAALVLPGRLPDRNAEAIGDATRPYVLSTPLFTPKDATNSTLTFASMEDTSSSMNLRRYNAVGGLMSSTTFPLGAKSSIIAFAAANSGAQMHVEIWSPTPNFTMELAYTNSSSAVVTIPYGDMFTTGAGGGFHALAPFRVCNTALGGANCAKAVIGAGGETTVQMSGVDGVPSRAQAVVFNLEVHPSGTGYVTAYPDGTSRPQAASVTYANGVVIANMVTVKLGTNGRIRLYNSAGSADAIVDLAGFYL